MNACLVLGSLGIPTLINAIHDTSDPFRWSLDLFLNYMIGLVGMVLAAVFGIAWYRTAGEAREIIDKIKSKPRHELPPNLINVGPLQSQSSSANSLDPAG